MRLSLFSFALASSIIVLPVAPSASVTSASVTTESTAAAANDLRRLPADMIIPAIRREGSATHDQILCLALAMYHEARGETEAERMAVAQVIYNRALHTNASICATVWADRGSQFQWVRSSATIVPREISAWETAQAGAMRFARHRPADNTHGATNFFNPALCSPDWARSGRVTVQMRQVFLRTDEWTGRFADRASAADPVSQLDQFGRRRPTRVYAGGRS
jgi:N-acetylmuramoyl-L-alanine amidase